ncbi:unnamed protein product [Brachionus calyciflorus]|uniref:Uncharacterized protein n=1 Tax=Brachionus calyciflorus TaxID=104777 RepID=A0A814QQ59_9BILA|nr:unnamed protein product [Brachionus calyciflorus]
MEVVCNFAQNSAQLAALESAKITVQETAKVKQAKVNLDWIIREIKTFGKYKEMEKETETLLQYQNSIVLINSIQLKILVYKKHMNN